MLAFGFLLGVGVLFAWRQSRGGDDPSGAKLLAVLPFENLGAAEDEHIPDGITDEVRGRLAMLPGVEVIARGSSTPYKRTTKPPQQIAQELGVRYLLTATVRWEKPPGGARNLYVGAELVEVRRRGAPRVRWQRGFAAVVTADSLAGVFQVYADIGSRVADPTAVGATFDGELGRLRCLPEQSLGASDPPTLRRAAAYYVQAIALDSGFAQAWVQLSRAHSILYFNSIPTPAEAEQARRAAARALAPNRAHGHLAMGTYVYHVLGDYARAVEEFDRGQKVAPNDASLLNAMALPEQSLGRWEAALGHLKQAQRLDPRSIFASGGGLTWALLSLRRYHDAGQAADRAFTLAPANLA